MGFNPSGRVKNYFISTLVILFISCCAYLLGWSSVLSVKQISFNNSGTEQLILTNLSRNGVEPKIGDQLARVDTRSIKRSLNQLSWVSSSEVSIDWFRRKVTISIIERIAIAKANSSQNSFVNFDNEGNIFTPVSPSQMSIQDKLPQVVTDLNNKDDLASAAILLRQIPSNLGYLIDELELISITKSGYIWMSTRINGGLVRINWGRANEVEQKSKVLVALLKLPENQQIKQVDLSQPDSPIVS